MNLQRHIEHSRNCSNTIMVELQASPLTWGFNDYKDISPGLTK